MMAHTLAPRDCQLFTWVNLDCERKGSDAQRSCAVAARNDITAYQLMSFRFSWGGPAGKHFGCLNFPWHSEPDPYDVAGID